MKLNKIDQIEVHREVSDFKLKLFKVLLIFFVLVCFNTLTYAQDFPFQEGEILNYDIRYKYGLVVMKGGTARYKVNFSNYENEPVVQSTLDFKTSSFFDKIYKIRDTLISYASIPKIDPLYHRRSVHEGGSAGFIEEMKILKHSDTYTEASVLRYRGDHIMVDTIISAENQGYDLLNIFLFIRNLDYSNLSVGETKNLASFLGRRKVNIILRYQGQSIVEKSETHKFKALKFDIDITDDVFTESSNAMEVWISDDKNRIPIKLKAKLKIGAAEADMTSYKNLKYPFTSEIRIPVKK